MTTIEKSFNVDLPKWRKGLTTIQIRCLVLGAFTLHPFTHTKASADFHFEGELTYVRYQIIPLNTPAATNLYRVEGTCSDENFLANVVPIAAEDDVEDRFGWDGVALRSISLWPSTPNSGLPRTNTVGNIEKVFVPRFLNKHSKALAIALASPSLLVGLTNTGDHGVWMFGLEPVPEDKCNYRVMLDPGGSYVREIEAWATNYLIFVPPSTKMLIPTPSPHNFLPEVYTNGYRHWIYHSVKFNADVKRPSSFEFTLFLPKSKRTGGSDGIANDDLYIVAAVHGNLEFRPSGAINISYLPKIDSEVLTVWDHRYRGDIVQNPIPEGTEGVFQHRLTGHNWHLDTNSIQERVARMVPIYRDLKNRKQRLNVFTIGAGMVVFLAPLLLLWWRQTKNQQPRQRDRVTQKANYE